MATGAVDANGVYLYGEDDSEATFSALLNKLGTSVGGTLKGRILQVVSGYTATTVTNNTSTYVGTGLTLSITPKSASSKLIVIASQCIGKDSDAASSYKMKLRRDTTDLLLLSNYGGYNWGQYGRETIPVTYLSNSTSTAATSFNFQFANTGGTGTVKTQVDGSHSTITIIEVSA